MAPGFCDAIRRPAEDGRGWAAWMGLVTLGGGSRINTSGGIVHFTGIAWAGQVDEPVERAPAEPREVGFVSGACMAIAREAWDEHPGLPAEYFLYFEDVDYSLRLALAGRRVGLEPAARVDHRYDFKGGRKWRLLERNRWATIVRTYPGALLAVLAPALLATELGLVAIALAAGWGREKALAYADVARALPRLLRERRAIQARRRVSAREFARRMTPDLSSPYLGRAAENRLLRALLRGYWRLVLTVLR